MLRLLSNGTNHATHLLNDPIGATVLAPFEPYFVESPSILEEPVVDEEYIDESLYQPSAPVTPQILQDTILENNISDMLVIIPVPFVSETENPQEYVDQYNSDESFKNWFDDNYPQYDSIEQAVGLELEPETIPEIDTQTVPDVQCGPGIEMLNGTCQPIIESDNSDDDTEGGGCLIATATYSSELAPQVQMLREIRDNSLLSTESGSSFMSTFNDVYYTFSPSIADLEREHPIFKETVKIAITPMITSLSLMEYADSENSVLSIGISLIVLNGMMYVGIPAVVIIGIKKKF